MYICDAANQVEDEEVLPKPDLRNNTGTKHECLDDMD